MQRMSKKDEITKLYFVDRENPATIAKKLNISKSAVTQVLQKDDRYKKARMTDGIKPGVHSCL